MLNAARHQTPDEKSKFSLLIFLYERDKIVGRFNFEPKIETINNLGNIELYWVMLFIAIYISKYYATQYILETI